MDIHLVCFAPIVDILHGDEDVAQVFVIFGPRSWKFTGFNCLKRRENPPVSQLSDVDSQNYHLASFHVNYLCKGEGKNVSCLVLSSVLRVELFDFGIPRETDSNVPVTVSSSGEEQLNLLNHFTIRHLHGQLCVLEKDHCHV